MTRTVLDRSAPAIPTIVEEHRTEGWERVYPQPSIRCSCGASFPGDSLVMAVSYQVQHARECRTHKYASSETFGRGFILNCTCGRDFSSTDVIEACSDFIAHLRKSRRWWAER